MPDLERFLANLGGAMEPCAGCGEPGSWGGERCPACERREREALTREELAGRPREEVLRSAGVPPRYREPFVALSSWPRDKRWADFDPLAWAGKPWLVALRGEVGAGKTFAAVELAYRWLRYRSVESRCFARAADVPAAAFAQDGRLWLEIRNAPILILDDLGRGYKGDALAPVGELIAHRFDEMLPTVVTTNARSEGEMGDPATVDRLKTGVHLHLDSRSRRRLERAA